MTSGNDAYKAGAIFRIKKVDFLNKPKYCLLMETYDGTRDPLIVIFLTSKVGKYKKFPWTVVVSKGTLVGLPEESLIDCNNNFKYSLEELKTRTDFIGILPDSFMVKVHNALTHARKVQFDDLIRMRDYEFY